MITGTFHRYSSPKFFGAPTSVPSELYPKAGVCHSSNGPKSEKALLLEASRIVATKTKTNCTVSVKREGKIVTREIGAQCLMQTKGCRTYRTVQSYQGNHCIHVRYSYLLDLIGFVVRERQAQTASSLLRCRAWINRLRCSCFRQFVYRFPGSSQLPGMRQVSSRENPRCNAGGATWERHRLLAQQNAAPFPEWRRLTVTINRAGG